MQNKFCKEKKTQQSPVNKGATGRILEIKEILNGMKLISQETFFMMQKLSPAEKIR